MKILHLKLETIRPIYTKEKIFCNFMYELFDAEYNLSEKHEMNILLENVELMPLSELMQLCTEKAQHYTQELQEQLNNGVQ